MSDQYWEELKEGRSPIAENPPPTIRRHTTTTTRYLSKRAAMTPDKRAMLVHDLGEGSCVLDERVHHESIAHAMKRAADALEADGIEITGLQGELAERTEQLAAAAVALEDFGEHRCILSRRDAGEPREDGYYQKIAGTWYRSDALPACDCGLTAAIDAARVAPRTATARNTQLSHETRATPKETSK